MKNSSETVLSRKKLEKAAYILKTIGHPTRLAIIELLKEHQEMTVNDLCDELETEQSVVSHHLLNMKAKGLLSSRKEGTNVYYELREKNVLFIMSAVEKCDCNM